MQLIKTNKDMTTYEKLVEAWENAPFAAKARVAVITGYKRQTLEDIISNNRKDVSILLTVHQAIKQASADITKKITEQNKTVQST